MFDTYLADWETAWPRQRPGDGDRDRRVRTGGGGGRGAPAGRRPPSSCALPRRWRTDRAHWSRHNWDAMAAEVAAAQNISHALAPGQIYLPFVLRYCSPEVAALFAEVAISAWLAAHASRGILSDQGPRDIADRRCDATLLVPYGTLVQWLMKDRTRCMAFTSARCAE